MEMYFSEDYSYTHIMYAVKSEHVVAKQRLSVSLFERTFLVCLALYMNMFAYKAKLALPLWVLFVKRTVKASNSGRGRRMSNRPRPSPCGGFKSSTGIYTDISKAFPSSISHNRGTTCKSGIEIARHMLFYNAHVYFSRLVARESNFHDFQKYVRKMQRL